MALDRTKARQWVDGARNAYARGPHAEFIQIGAGFLGDALLLITDNDLIVMRAQNENATLQRAIDEEKTAYRKLREQAQHTDTMVAVLRAIAASPKGASKKAAEQLAAMGVEATPPVLSTPTPDRTVVA